jgi:hypothetical protein
MFFKTHCWFTDHSIFKSTPSDLPCPGEEIGLSALYCPSWSGWVGGDGYVQTFKNLVIHEIAILGLQFHCRSGFSRENMY